MGAQIRILLEATNEVYGLLGLNKENKSEIRGEKRNGGGRQTSLKSISLRYSF